MRDRSGFWTKTFDPSTKKLYGKTSTGGNSGGGHNHFHEASEYNYLWTFAHDWTKLIRELGGKSAAITELDRLMSVPSSTPFTGEDAEPAAIRLNGGESSQYLYLGNEPAFQTPWAYNWAGDPSRAQYNIPRAMNLLFDNSAKGLPGNDDMGPFPIGTFGQALVFTQLSHQLPA